VQHEFELQIERACVIVLLARPPGANGGRARFHRRGRAHALTRISIQEMVAARLRQLPGVRPEGPLAAGRDHGDLTLRPQDRQGKREFMHKSHSLIVA
jgi:hypothetical protein